LAKAFLRLWGKEVRRWFRLGTEYGEWLMEGGEKEGVEEVVIYLEPLRKEGCWQGTEAAAALAPAAATVAAPAATLECNDMTCSRSLFSSISSEAAAAVGMDGGGMGVSIFLSLLQLWVSKERLALKPNVVVMGELMLCGNIISGYSHRQHRGKERGREGEEECVLAGMLRAAREGGVGCLILPKDMQEDVASFLCANAAGAASAAVAGAAGAAAAAAAPKADVRFLFAEDIVDLLGFVSGSFSFSSSIPPPSYWGNQASFHPSSLSFRSSSPSPKLSLLVGKRLSCTHEEKGWTGEREEGWIYVAPTLLPVDDVSVSFRRVEVAVLLGGGRGQFLVTTTGLASSSSSSLSSFTFSSPSSSVTASPILLSSNSINRTSSSGSNGNIISSRRRSNCGGGKGEGGGGAVCAAINVARVLLLKNQQQLCQFLGPPTIDLRAMSSLPSSLPSSLRKKIDILVYIPQCLPSAAVGAYALPAFLALVAACWPGLRGSLDGTGSLGELNGMGTMSLHSCRLPPSFVSSLPSSVIRKMVMPRAQACELVRSGGGVGDKWLLGNGVLVVGTESILDAIQCFFLGNDRI